MRETLALEESEYGLRVYAVAPGIADTNMQALIRSADEEVFPAVKKFKEFKQTDAFNTVGLVAEHIRDLAFDEEYAHDEVVVRIPAEKG